MNQEKIGKFILKLRTERKLSQYQLAEMIPISRQAVSKWERGQTIPDSSTLLRLSEIFDVTINELLEGRMIEKNNIKTLEQTTLNIVDESNKKSKKIKKYLITFTTIIIILLLIFLSYYFINSYNTIKVYTVSGTNDKIDIYDGIFITTKEKSYLKLGKVKRNESDIKRIRLYYKNNNNRIIISENKDIDEIILDNYGYNEHIEYKDLKLILKNSYIEIIFNDNTTTIVKLKFERDFVNNKFIFRKENDAVTNQQSIPVSSTEQIDTAKIVSKIKEKGISSNKAYIYKIEKVNYSFIYHEEIHLIQMISDNHKWDYYTKINSFSCSKSKNNTLYNDEKCKKIIMEDIDKYLLNEGSN